MEVALGLFLAILKLANRKPISKALQNVLVGKISKSTTPRLCFLTNKKNDMWECVRVSTTQQGDGRAKFRAQVSVLSVNMVKGKSLCRFLF